MTLQPSSIDKEQEKMMLHALGLDWKSKPYRNRYTSYGMNHEFEKLVNIGYAVKHEFKSGMYLVNGIDYVLTDEGIRAVTNGKFGAEDIPR